MNRNMGFNSRETVPLILVTLVIYSTVSLLEGQFQEMFTSNNSLLSISSILKASLFFEFL